ncbi:TonB-dependent receptor [Colwelliaceae bacterium MEBiC 14330]
MTKLTTWKQFKYSALAIACGTALLNNVALAADANFSGRVTDASNSVYFEGAQVRIVELALTTVTARDGSFNFSEVPAGTYTLEINYLGADKVSKSITIGADGSVEQNFIIGADQSAIENIIVYGQRASQAGAINRQRNADNLMSVVSADTIGQSPDQNAAEALQRLPGMSIQRDQGEGRFVAIRGIDPNLNNVTINGVNVPSPEGGVRSVAMDVIPSELIQSLEVSKTVTPDMDANAVGGSVEVKSLSAFDRQGRSYSATIQGSYNELMEELSPKLSGSFTDIFNLSGGTKLGVASAISWFERKFGSHNMETDGGWAEFEYEDAATGDDIEAFGAEEIEQRHYAITRERLGIALNFDLHTSPTDKYYLRTLYSKFSDDEFRTRNQYKLADGALDSSTYTSTSAQFIDAEMERDTKDRYEEQDILSMVLGGENEFNHWLVEYDLGYSKAKEAEPNRIDVTFAGEDFLLGYQSTGAVPSLMQSAAAHQLANFDMDEIAYENNLAEDEELSVKLDFSRDFVWYNNNATFKFGFKHQSREKANTVDATIYDDGFNEVTAAPFETAAPSYQLGNFGPGLNQNSLASYVQSNLNQFEINELDTLIDSKGSSYFSEEQVSSAYAMITLDIDKWRIITGFRYEDTRFETTGNRVELIEDEVNDEESVNITPWQVSKDYDHLLPSLNVKYQASEKLLARFAYTQTIARPTFGDSAAFQLIESEVSEDDGVIETERKAEVGNPDLETFESDNIDFSIEYYPGNIGVLSAGLFFKDISNYVVVAEVQDNGQWDGFAEVMQPINGGDASLTGLELAWTKNFASGLFISANGTFVDTDDDLPNQADTLANLMFGYENNKFSARLSTSYKSESFQFVDNDSAVYEDTHTQVDFSAKYYFSDTMQVYFNAINITDEPLYIYHGNSAYNYQYEEYGASFELGFTLNSL